MKLWPKHIGDRIQCVTLLIAFASINMSAWTHHALRVWDAFTFGLNLGLYLHLHATFWLRKLADARAELIKHYETREILHKRYFEASESYRRKNEQFLNDWRNS